VNSQAPTHQVRPSPSRRPLPSLLEIITRDASLHELQQLVMTVQFRKLLCFPHTRDLYSPTIESRDPGDAVPLSRFGLKGRANDKVVLLPWLVRDFNLSITPCVYTAVSEYFHYQRSKVTDNSLEYAVFSYGRQCQERGIPELRRTLRCAYWQVIQSYAL
jgi:hypothetical protein